MTLKRYAVAAAAVCLLWTAGSAEAALITSYTLDGDVAPSTVLPGATASNLEDGSGNPVTFGPGNPGQSAFKSFADLPNDDLNLLSSNSWLGFSVTPDAGHQLNLATLQFDAQRDKVTGAVGNPASNAHVTFQLAYSLDGTSFIAVGDPATLTANDGGWDQYSIDLSTVTALQDIAGQVWLRLFVHDQGRAATDAGFHIDNVALQGVVHTPEPSSILLLALGALPIAGWRLRRRTLA